MQKPAVRLQKEETAALQVTSKRGASPTCLAAIFSSGVRMDARYAILIDGGFVRKKLGTAVQPATADGIKAFSDRVRSRPEFSGLRLHRIYYYDAAPTGDAVSRPLGGGQLDFGKTPQYARSMQLHAALAKEPYFALRLGELALQGWKPRANLARMSGLSVTLTHEDLVPNIQQKGVDMRIGLDIASLTLKRQVQIIALVTADSDFIPAMKFARREGAELFLVTMGHGIKPSMFDHADVVITDLA